MALSEQTLHELSNELLELRRRKDAIDVAIKGIEVVLETRPRKDKKSQPSRTAPVDEGRPGSRPKPVIRGALRQRLIALLTESDGLRCGEIVSLLNAEPFLIGGKELFRDRVSHELSRLRRLGVLRRSPSGRYRVVVSAPRAAVVSPEAATETIEVTANQRADFMPS